MQLGITIPFQNYLKGKNKVWKTFNPVELKNLTYGEPEDLFFCWELHNIKYKGKNSLIIVNANNRFAILLYDMKSLDFKELFTRVEEGIHLGLETEGYTKEQINAYFNLAGEAILTKTHGRKPVAGLNKAVEHLIYVPYSVDTSQLYQPLQSRGMNRDICKPIGFEEYGYPVGFLEEDMRRVGIIK